jgi:hypothetical protein
VNGSLLIILQGLCRIVIGVQLVIAGFQLPAKYQQARWKEMAICLLPVMTVMWICTSLCILVTIPKLSLLLSSDLALPALILSYHRLSPKAHSLTSSFLVRCERLSRLKRVRMTVLVSRSSCESMRIGDPEIALTSSSGWPRISFAMRI